MPIRMAARTTEAPIDATIMTVLEGRWGVGEGGLVGLGGWGGGVVVTVGAVRVVRGGVVSAVSTMALVLVAVIWM